MNDTQHRALRAWRRHGWNSIVLSLILGLSYLTLIGLASILLGLPGMILGIMLLIVIPQVALAVIQRQALKLVRAREPTEEEADRFQGVLTRLDLTHAPEDIRFEVFSRPRPTAAIINSNGNGIQILVSESLLSLVDEAQAATIIAHELGHHYCPNNWSLQWVMMPTKFFLKILTLPHKYGRPGRLVAGVLRGLFLPFEWLFVMSQRENERCADAFIVALNGDVDAFCALLTSLLREHTYIDEAHGRKPFARDRNGPLRTHPSINERIAMLRRLA